jgi:hypothetical protein
MATVKTQPKSITTKTATVNIQSPKAMSDFSKELKKFIIQNNLYSPIKDKNYVHVEGWQFAGASLGLFPIIEKVEDVSPGIGEIKYRAEVKLIRIGTGETVGYGVAICSNKEAKKSSFDEYAVASMAQTRAVGKAFRLSIGWVMKLAGYEATTVEEMDGVKNETTTTEDAQQVAIMPIEDVQFLVNTRLAALSVPEKLKFLKDNIGTISDKEINEMQYRILYEELVKQREAKEDV